MENNVRGGTKVGLILLLLLMLSIPQTALAVNSSITLFWQDKPVLTQLGPQISKGIIYVPVKIVESAGGLITYDSSKLIVGYQNKQYTLDAYDVNSEYFEALKVFENEYYLKLDTLSQLFNFNVTWDSKEKTIFISEKTLRPTVLGVDFSDVANKASLIINCNGNINYQVEKNEAGKWRVDLFDITLKEPLSLLLIEHPLLYSVRAEQLSRDQVTFHIQGQDGLALQTRVEKNNLVLDFCYTVESFEYRNVGGLPLLFYESSTGLPDYREYLDKGLNLVREFSGVTLTGERKKISINDDIAEYFEYYQEGTKVVCVIKLKPTLAEFFQDNVSSRRLAQLSQIASKINDIGTELLFTVMGNPFFTVEKSSNRLFIDFQDTEGNNIVRDLEYTTEFAGLTVTKLKDNTLRVEILLRDYKGYAVTKKDNYTYSVQLVNKNLVSKLIVIDPGHGGHDPGALGTILQEKDLNLDVSKRLYDLLGNFGYKAILTRETDLYVSLSDRTKLSLSSGADLFVSVHTNASLSIGASGIETFYAPKNQEAQVLAGIVQKAVLAKVDSLDRGAKEANLWVLAHNIPHSILVEIGFITNISEEERLKQESYRQEIAEGLYNGIISFLNY